MWWTWRTLSFDLPLQHWQMWLSLESTYSRTFQESSWSPSWYSFPEISGFLILWMSKAATSTTIFEIGKILWTFAIMFKCVSIFCFTDGANQPLFLDFTRFLNRGLRYLVFLFLRFLRASRRVERLSTTSFLNSTLASKSTFFSVVAEIPIYLLPASTPREIDWT